MCRLSQNQGASTSWNPQDLSTPVQELLYLFTLRICFCGPPSVKEGARKARWHTYWCQVSHVRSEVWCWLAGLNPFSYCKGTDHHIAYLRRQGDYSLKKKSSVTRNIHQTGRPGLWVRTACSFRSAQAVILLEFMYHSRVVLSVGGSVWYMIRNLRCTVTIDSL
jgi:hypothetical protein